VNTLPLYSWLDSIKPLLEAVSMVLLLGSGVIAARAARTSGLLLLCVACLLSAIILAGFLPLDVELRWKLGFFPFPVRRWGIVLATFLYPIQLFIWPVAVFMVARQHRANSTPTI
jgi:hypothetical protein